MPFPKICAIGVLLSAIFWTDASISAIMEVESGDKSAKRQPRGRRQDAMAQALEISLLFAAIFVITAIGIAVVRRYWGRSADDRQYHHEMMSNFRELYAEGGLSDEEFRTIKTKLASEMKSELNGNSDKG